MRPSAVILLCAVILSASVSAQVPAAHASLNCAVCHPPPTGASTPSSRQVSATPPPEQRSTDAEVVCASCHDGSIAPSGTSRFSILSHPVDIPYKEHDGEFAPIKNEGGKWSFDSNPVNPGTRLKLFADDSASRPVVKCTSCHDPHDNTRGSHLRDRYYNGNETKFCSTCHVGKVLLAAAQ